MTAIGSASGAPDRVLGTHYWNPPLLMPLVEVIRGEHTDQGRVTRVLETLESLGKQPVVVERDLPGFVWNRLQFALLREAIAIVQDGVADASTVDVVVSDGLARRWRYAGPFHTAALGGSATFEKIAANLFPGLSDAQDAAGLGSLVGSLGDDLEQVAQRRDRGLAADLSAGSR